MENHAADRELVDEVLAGDRYAFGKIIKNTEALVAMIVFKMIANSGDRKDLVQDIYLKTFHGLPNFRFKSKLSTWIGQIAYHTCLHYLEKRKLLLLDQTDNGEETSELTLEALSNQKLSASENDIEKQLNRKELNSILEKEIDKLPPVYRTLLILYREELSNEEMMQITGLPEGTIKSYLFRARKTLKENILSNYKKEDL
ncbi:sigma-70 family RNA polymerase sigma factor [Mucilaginibacter sp. UR6-11]|uniref:sigma-70 family RNA polymerase sigma factor n=1 Tax=Mucilaginibacter sp. UR6-11 TaxID=1435644 RepID=UPI001E4283C3|nr:sigma-70 family RNA polymerase sigma factor [Mucilaginibacter sp. UR6-11]MCC8424391.1 sigma-70 family RNA polymerase sigma factor [Mucilaginibacter sp. UR6-11]